MQRFSIPKRHRQHRRVRWCARWISLPKPRSVGWAQRVNHWGRLCLTNTRVMTSWTLEPIISRHTIIVTEKPSTGEEGVGGHVCRACEHNATESLCFKWTHSMHNHRRTTRQISGHVVPELRGFNFATPVPLARPILLANAGFCDCQGWRLALPHLLYHSAPKVRDFGSTHRPVSR